MITEEDKKVIKQMIREEFENLIPEYFSRTLKQLREFFISNIT